VRCSVRCSALDSVCLEVRVAVCVAVCVVVCVAVCVAACTSALELISRDSASGCCMSAHTPIHLTFENFPTNKLFANIYAFVTSAMS